MTEGYRSPSGLWIGGASGRSRKSGYFSALGIWIGGVGAKPPTLRDGYRSLLAFWLGGAAALIAAPVPPVPVPVRVEARRWPGPPIIIYEEVEPFPAWQRRRENEEIIIL